jgi:hypothetical protein
MIKHKQGKDFIEIKAWSNQAKKKSPFSLLPQDKKHHEVAKLSQPFL